MATTIHGIPTVVRDYVFGKETHIWLDAEIEIHDKENKKDIRFKIPPLYKDSFVQLIFHVGFEEQKQDSPSKWVQGIPLGKDLDQNMGRTILMIKSFDK